VTCDRVIELRNTDINRPKSTTAVRAVTAMNPAFYAVAYESKVRVLCVSVVLVAVMSRSSAHYGVLAQERNSCFVPCDNDRCLNLYIM
jgi:hypothetical protein